MWKTISTILGILAIIVSASVGYGKLQEKQKNISDKVIKVDNEVEIIKEDVVENTTVNREQAIIIERTTKLLDEIEKRVYKK
jgi:hypothetical protein